MHKLILTSVIIFFPWEWQMRVAMIMISCHLCVILIMSPYLRKGDDALHQVVQVELMLVVLAGHVYTTLDADMFTDYLLTVALFFVFTFMMTWFTRSLSKSCKATLYKSKSKSIKAIRGALDIEEDYLPPKYQAACEYIGTSFMINRDKITNARVRTMITQVKHAQMNDSLRTAELARQLQEHKVHGTPEVVINDVTKADQKNMRMSMMMKPGHRDRSKAGPQLGKKKPRGRGGRHLANLRSAENNGEIELSSLQRS